jgi:5-methylcytosine-specific restriction endonuclease McrA
MSDATKTQSMHRQLTCTIREFHKFIEPKIRNDIQTLTKREKRKFNNICQDCGKQTELEAAHLKGYDRVRIVNEILKKYMINEKEQIIQVDLDRVTNEILEAHKPINEHFRFLCSECHRKYDKEEEKVANQSKHKRPNTEANTSKKSAKFHKWTEEDDIVTLYLYKFEDKGLPYSLAEVGEKLGMGVDSLKMRIANFKAIDKKTGLANFSKQSLKIYKEFTKMPETELRSLVLKTLSACGCKTEKA